MTPKKKRLVNLFGKEPETLDEVAQCVIMSINDKLKGENNRVVGFKWDVIYGKVSNTHYCPETGKTNWTCEPHLPHYYQGFSGRVWIRYEKETKTFYSESFKDSLTYPGTGGAGSYNGPFAEIAMVHYNNYGRTGRGKDMPAPVTASWDFRFFEDDWPAPCLVASQQKLFEKITGNDPSNFRHVFTYIDEETATKDKQFIESCKHENFNI